MMMIPNSNFSGVKVSSLRISTHYGAAGTYPDTAFDSTLKP